MSVPTKQVATLLLSLLVIVNVYTIYTHSRVFFEDPYPQAMIDCEGKRDAISQLIINDYLQVDYVPFYDYETEEEEEISIPTNINTSHSYDYSTLMLDFLCNCQDSHLMPPQALNIEP